MVTAEIFIETLTIVWNGPVHCSEELVGIRSR